MLEIVTAPRVIPRSLCAIPLPKVEWKTRYVYFIQAASGPIKIGKSGLVANRLSELQTASWEELSLIGWDVDKGGAEGALHRRFAAARIRGEWFHPIAELIAAIEASEGRRPCAA